MAEIKQEHLNGQVFNYSEAVAGEDGKVKFEARKRPLTLKDIISQKDAGDAFIVVTGDGRKLTLPKKPAAEAGPNAGDESGKKGK